MKSKIVSQREIKKVREQFRKSSRTFFDLFANSFNKVFELILENEDIMR